MNLDPLVMECIQADGTQIQHYIEQQFVLSKKWPPQIDDALGIEERKRADDDVRKI